MERDAEPARSRRSRRYYLASDRAASNSALAGAAAAAGFRLEPPLDDAARRKGIARISGGEAPGQTVSARGALRPETDAASRRYRPERNSRMAHASQSPRPASRLRRERLPARRG